MECINNVYYYNQFGKQAVLEKRHISPLSILPIVNTICGLFRVTLDMYLPLVMEEQNNNIITDDL